MTTTFEPGKELMKTSDTLVFVYGTLKQGGSLNRVMDDIEASFVGPGHIDSRHWIMRDLGGFPGLEEVKKGEGCKQIHGEIYLIDRNHLGELDRVESYPTLYQRKQLEIKCGDQTFTAWVYYLNPNQYPIFSNRDIIENGDWTELPYADGGQNYTDDPVGTSFTVGDGIYITTNFGESYGPFNSIKDALEAIQTMGEHFDTDVNTLNVGIRLIRDGITPNEMDDIYEHTHKISV